MPAVSPMPSFWRTSLQAVGALARLRRIGRFTSGVRRGQRPYSSYVDELVLPELFHRADASVVEVLEASSHGGESQVEILHVLS